ncbi:unnamed protein product [Phytophthora lilii]|uniref:Unnamed protein product n=1 Tax=Phytophthora lilii TaxID=2077276 RepID=A0A9W6TGL1_9STRA|nr:unnamed protein product [Phytophthora lilii]
MAGNKETEQFWCSALIRNRSDRPTTIGKDIDFEELAKHPEYEREMMLNAENGMGLDSDDEEEIRIV